MKLQGETIALCGSSERAVGAGIDDGGSASHAGTGSKGVGFVGVVFDFDISVSESCRDDLGRDGRNCGVRKGSSGVDAVSQEDAPSMAEQMLSVRRLVNFLGEHLPQQSNQHAMAMEIGGAFALDSVSAKNCLDRGVFHRNGFDINALHLHSSFQRGVVQKTKEATW
ncbi:rab3 GTPase activating protein non catalytic [Echinococcus multilocularis]|uniref:Rab3 GTPase activating protein non catalytic n=1 Tax=Echinococcus multilocularis TaxID=6211 RepID=A0A0S4MQ85_ECHMU|nr:rab3 GTPase activating protein non catalytic [Echinococcus multilocularis]CUT99808.1 rab3 GTPase activating protein non catalytic [Echinococcus multilocularis]